MTYDNFFFFEDLTTIALMETNVNPNCAIHDAEIFHSPSSQHTNQANNYEL